MKWEKGNVFDLCDINPENISRNYPHDFIRYFDITSVGSGVATVNDEIPLSEAPSRAKRVVRNSDTILATVRPGNRSFYYFKYASENSIASTGFAVLRPKENKTDPRFLYYLVSDPGFTAYLVAYEQGANYPAVNPDIIGGKPIEFPPLPSQRKIASILSAYDDLIENNLKRIKLLEEKAFASYKLLVNSEKLIEGKVGDLADVKSGYAFKSRDWSDEGFPVIKIKNIGNNDIELTDCSFIPENIAEAANKFKLNAGDLLIAMTGATVGKIGMMPKTETSFYLNQRVGIFKPKVENAELFLFCFFNEPSAKNAVESLASGAAQPNISGSQLESIKLYYPKLDTVTEFGNSIKSHFELIWNLKEQNTKLREARDILLPRLMNGQIEV